jgi:hypothetical protein
MRMYSLDVFLVDQGLILSLLTAVPLECLLVLGGSGVHSHEQECVLVVLLDELEGPRGVRLYILLDLLDCLAVLLLVHDVPLLLEGHLIFQLQCYLTLSFKPLPGLTVLGLPILCGYCTL